MRPSRAWISLLASLCATPALAQVGAQPGDVCTVSVLNQTAFVDAKTGTWQVPSIPINGGQVRVRVNCVSPLGEAIRTGRSDFIVIQPNGTHAVVPITVGDQIDTGPQSLSVSATPELATAPGQKVQIKVIGTYADGSTEDLTGALGVTLVASNPAVLALDPKSGVGTAKVSGRVLVTAIVEGAVATRLVEAKLGKDTDGDGLPDDYEASIGLDPGDPTDALGDKDEDGLTALEEYTLGSNPFQADSDGDGLGDKEESIAGDDGYVTSAMAADTDGDLLRDAVEIATGTDPTNPKSFDFAKALTGLVVKPAKLHLVYNTLVGEASIKVAVTGLVIDGTGIDLTAHPLTTWGSKDLAVASFGEEKGRVFAGTAGETDVVVANSGHTATLPVTVSTFSPKPFAAVPIPGCANDVALAGDRAYVAAGAAGLQVVTVGPPAEIATAVPLPGTAYAVREHAGYALVASGEAGLHVVDVSNLAAVPSPATLDTPGTAWDVAADGTLAVVADGTGLVVVNLLVPDAPAVAGTLATATAAVGIDLQGSLAVLAVSEGGLEVVDVSAPSKPAALATLTLADGAREVALGGGYAYVAIGNGGLAVVSLADPSAPKALTTLGKGAFMLQDVVANGTMLFGADYYRVNSVPVLQAAIPSAPLFVDVVEFSSYNDANGTGIDADLRNVAMTGIRGAIGKGATGDGYVFLGQWNQLEDDYGVPPACAIASPAPLSDVVEGSDLLVTVDATDDVFVDRVRFYVDGKLVGEDPVAPFALAVPIPLGPSLHALGAEAVDLGGNESAMDAIVVNAIADPGTTLVGKVVTEMGTPVASAQVTVLKVMLGIATGADGTFALPGVPSANPLRLSVLGAIDGAPHRDGFGPFATVPGGTTDVGTLVLETPLKSDTEGGLSAQPVSFFGGASDETGHIPLGGLSAQPVAFFGGASDETGRIPLGGLSAQPVAFFGGASDETGGIPLGGLSAAPVSFMDRPLVGSVAPGTVSRAAGQVTLTVTGFGLDDATGVKLFTGGKESTTLVGSNVTVAPDSASLTVLVTMSPLAPKGTWSVVVVSAIGSSADGDAGSWFTLVD